MPAPFHSSKRLRRAGCAGSLGLFQLLLARKGLAGCLLLDALAALLQRRVHRAGGVDGHAQMAGVAALTLQGEAA